MNEIKFSDLGLKDTLLKSITEMGFENHPKYKQRLFLLA